MHPRGQSAQSERNAWLRRAQMIEKLALSQHIDNVLLSTFRAARRHLLARAAFCLWEI
jgi:hypothetical protein